MKRENRTEIKLTDQIVSNNIKKRRINLGLTQQKVAEAIGVSIQQLQKYEKGINRVSSGKLNGLAIFLKVPINYFFQQDQENEILNSSANNLSDRKLLTLIKAFSKIKNTRIKNTLIEFINLIAYK